MNPSKVLTVFLTFLTTTFALAEIEIKKDELQFGLNTTISVPGVFFVNFPNKLSPHGSPVPMLITIRTQADSIKNR
jgi:hypothetical protein